MPYVVRRSLLLQLLSVYLLFVVVVLAGGLAVNAIVEQHLSDDVYASDRALAQEIALETGLRLQDAEGSLVALGNLVKQASSPEQIEAMLRTYKATRSDADDVYWLYPLGALRVSWPANQDWIGAEF